MFQNAPFHLFGLSIWKVKVLLTGHYIYELIKYDQTYHDRNNSTEYFWGDNENVGFFCCCRRDEAVNGRGKGMGEAGEETNARQLVWVETGEN